ncbi:30S ribosome-binding factor RbfA [Roseicitreum antarcticum]|nr:30S ribosome-binding factor RbfA [Roseicitreum antarcticum]
MAQNRSSMGKGPTQRQLRVAELIRRTLSDVLARGDVHDPELTRVSITVGEVRTSPDLKVATVFVMPLGGLNRDEVLLALRRNKSELRRAVSKALTLKFAPDLKFALDETFDQMDETRRLFSDAQVLRDIAAPDEDEADQSNPGDGDDDPARR